MSVFRRRLMGAQKSASVAENLNYLTIEALEDGLTAKLTRTACEYSIDGGEWVRLASNTSTPAINAGHIISFKANDPDISSSYGIGTFTITKRCNLKGNCMSMFAYDDAANMTTVQIQAFKALFKNCTNIINVEKGFLPATTLNNYCYHQMFYGCSNLTTVPDLPATSLKSYCYYSMFGGCVSLTQAPELPATTLREYCYFSMFDGCVSLTQAPELPATTLAQGCYYGMFYGCGSLKTAPELPATTLASKCYYRMFYNCSSLVVAPKLPATTLDTSVYSYMFYGCKSLVDAPELPATTMALQCYSYMFYNCSSLERAPELPATTLREYCYSNMFAYCSSLETAPELPAETIYLYRNCYDSMFMSCNKLTDVPKVSAGSLSIECCYRMFAYCTSLTSTPSMEIHSMDESSCAQMFIGCTTLRTINIVISEDKFYESSCSSMFEGCERIESASSLFVMDADTILADNCFNAMFRGCTNLTIAPDLPSLQLAANCYAKMFENCRWLHNAPELPATTLAQGCYYGMFQNCHLSFIVLPALELVEGCYERMFYGCGNLEEIKALFLTTPSMTYTNKWVYGVSASGRFTKNKRATWDVSGENGIPVGWTIATFDDGSVDTLNDNVELTLNKQWARNDSISPDDSAYAAYESVSNVGVHNSEAIMYITINGLSSFRLYLRSYAENLYDYAMVSQLNASIDGNTSTTSSDVKDHTKGSQKGGTSLSSYKEVVYDNIPSGENVITVVYRKDGSGNAGTDKAYVLIPK